MQQDPACDAVPSLTPGLRLSSIRQTGANAMVRHLRMGVFKVAAEFPETPHFGPVSHDCPPAQMADVDCLSVNAPATVMRGQVSRKWGGGEGRWVGCLKRPAPSPTLG